MNEARIEQLHKFLEETPDDPFLIYALATEYKEDNKQKSKYYFDKLLAEHPDYVGTYYHAAALYAEEFDINKAEEIYNKGIEVAKAQDDQHALRELQNAYTNFQFEND